MRWVYLKLYKFFWGKERGDVLGYFFVFFSMGFFGLLFWFVGLEKLVGRVVLLWGYLYEFF